MKYLDKHDVIVQKIEGLKRGEFKATAIKVELEAHFERGRNGSCGDCDGGRVECGECDGNYENASECENCDGRGNLREYTNSVGEVIPEQECDDCAGSGEVNCTYCEEGWNDCDYCDGSSDGWGSDQHCHDWLMEKLSDLGLAERDTPISLSHDYTTEWSPRGALKYAEFYRDGSVDSEFTFTLSLDNPENVFLLPKIIKIWNELGDAIGNGVSVERAGMHMALINDPDCVYPSRSREQDDQFHNFQKSLSLLLPALFFLGSGDDKSRELRFRQPRVASRYSDYNDNKYSAIFYSGGAVEFRLFNTCYDNPDVILDNLVVISNCMRYWTKKYKPSGLSRITPQVSFGNNRNDKLDRFYLTVQHVDLLNAGLAKLKPAYYSIREVKKQRNFGVNKRLLNKQTVERRKEAEIEYQEYEERFSWNMLVRKNRWTADLIEETAYNRRPISEVSTVMTEVEQKVEAQLKEEAKRKKTLEKYVAEKLAQLNEDSGQYTLSEEV